MLEFLRSAECVVPMDTCIGHSESAEGRKFWVLSGASSVDSITSGNFICIGFICHLVVRNLGASWVEYQVHGVVYAKDLDPSDRAQVPTSRPGCTSVRNWTNLVKFPNLVSLRSMGIGLPPKFEV